MLQIKKRSSRSSWGTWSSWGTSCHFVSDGFGGGETTFYNADGCAPGTTAAAGVSPTEGGCLCFPHGDAEDSPVHEGSPVNAGLKYIIRTDVLFDKESKKADPTQGTALAEGKE